MNALWLLTASAALISAQTSHITGGDAWEPINLGVRQGLIKALGFDPGFDEQMQDVWRGRPSLYVARKDTSSIGVIDCATGRLCRLLYVSDLAPHLDEATTLPRSEAQEHAREFLDRAGWQLGPEWRLRECDLVDHGASGWTWHLVYDKRHRNVRLPARLRLVMHAGTGTIQSFRLDDDQVEEGLELRVPPEAAASAVAARAGFARHSIRTLELAIGYETPDWEGRQDLFWEMRLINPDARSLRDSEVMWARVNARTGRVVDFGMPSVAPPGSVASGPPARSATRTAGKRVAKTTGWDASAIRKAKWPRTAFDCAGEPPPSRAAFTATVNR